MTDARPIGGYVLPGGRQHSSDEAAENDPARHDAAHSHPTVRKSLTRGWAARGRWNGDRRQAWQRSINHQHSLIRLGLGTPCDGARGPPSTRRQHAGSRVGRGTGRGRCGCQAVIPRPKKSRVGPTRVAHCVRSLVCAVAAAPQLAVELLQRLGRTWAPGSSAAGRRAPGKCRCGSGSRSSPGCLP